MSDQWDVIAKPDNDTGVGDVIQKSEVPPGHDEVIIALANEVKRYVGRRPTMMPFQPDLAAEWWVIMQERCRKGLPPKGEYPQLLSVPTKYKEDPKKRWDYPYRQRLQQNLRKFLRLPDAQQRLIVAAQEDGIYWRGEDTETRHKALDNRTMFENIIAETEKMRENPEQYKKKANILRKAFLAR